MKNYKKLANFLFLAYLIILFWIILFKISLSFEDWSYLFKNQQRSINLIPFPDSLNKLSAFNISETLSNVVIFIPFGIIIEIVNKKQASFVKVLLIFLFSLSIESFQYIFGIGFSDITDIIINTSGGLIGISFYKLLNLKIDKKKLDQALTILCLVTLLLITLILMYLKFSNL